MLKYIKFVSRACQIIYILSSVLLHDLFAEVSFVNFSLPSKLFFVIIVAACSMVFFFPSIVVVNWVIVARTLVRTKAFVL